MKPPWLLLIDPANDPSGLPVRGLRPSSNFLCIWRLNPEHMNCPGFPVRSLPVELNPAEDRSSLDRLYARAVCVIAHSE